MVVCSCVMSINLRGVVFPEFDRLGVPISQWESLLMRRAPEIIHANCHGIQRGHTTAALRRLGRMTAAVSAIAKAAEEIAHNTEIGINLQDMLVSPSELAVAADSITHDQYARGGQPLDPYIEACGRNIATAVVRVIAAEAVTGISYDSSDTNKLQQ